MTTLISDLSQGEAGMVKSMLSRHGINSHISGSTAYDFAGHRAAPKISLLVPRKNYRKARRLVQEHYPQFLPAPEEKVCEKCEAKGNGTKYDLARLGLIRGLYTFFMIYMFHVSFCPNCGKLH
jgi:hypothetical protein